MCWLNWTFWEGNTREESPSMRLFRSRGNCLICRIFCIDKARIKISFKQLPLKFLEYFLYTYFYLLCDEKQLKGDFLIIVECTICKRRRNNVSQRTPQCCPKMWKESITCNSVILEILRGQREVSVVNWFLVTRQHRRYVSIVHHRKILNMCNIEANLIGITKQIPVLHALQCIYGFLFMTFIIFLTLKRLELIFQILHALIKLCYCDVTGAQLEHEWHLRIQQN